MVDGFVLRKGRFTGLKFFRGAIMNDVYFVGLAHSSLPEFVRAHAKHILANPSQTRPAIELLPHQLISNKQV